MKKLIIGGLAALAIGLTGCSAATAEPVPTKPITGVPFDFSEVVVNPKAPTKTPCLILVPGHWLCPEGVAPPQN